MQFEVLVELKKEVLDTQGRAIKETLNRLGHNELIDIHVSKRFVLDIAGNDKEAFEKAEFLAKEHLANPVSETFVVRKLENG